MARTLARLTAKTIKNLEKPGLHPDGGGLYLQISQTGTKSWLFRFRSPISSRERYMGLGRYDDNDSANRRRRGDGATLAQARDLAADARTVLGRGQDPIEQRHTALQEARLEAAKAMTFEQAAEAFITAYAPGWSNAKHAAQWRSSLKKYAYPVLRDIPVQKVDLGLILKVLEPIWTKVPETASRVRGRIEQILGWCTVRGLRTGDNPARWRGHLDKVGLPPIGKVRPVEHHPALPYGDLPAFLVALREQAGVASLALEFAILTAARTGEVIGARWGEVSVQDKLWIVPKDRMKARLPHRVPLSDGALMVLERIAPAQPDPKSFVFPGGGRGKGLSNMALAAVLKRMKRTNITTHGFRSTFRDWAAEKTRWSREVAETALAHTLDNKVEAAYRRTDFLEQRRSMMAEWDQFCAGVVQGGQVVSMRVTA